MNAAKAAVHLRNGRLIFDHGGLHLETQSALRTPFDVDAVDAAHTLLEQWFARLQRQRDGETIFLPFDFTDDETHLIVVERRGDVVDLQAAALSASRADSLRQWTSRTDFLTSIAESIQRLRWEIAIAA